MAIDEERASDVRDESAEIADSGASGEYEQEDAPGFDDEGFLAKKKAEERHKQKKREEETRMAAKALIRYRLGIDN